MENKFWELKAKTYPIYTDDEIKESIKLQLDFLKECGVDFKDKKILDIGCGTGNFTFNLVKEAKYILGIDISDSMLRVFDEIRERNSFFNVFSEKMDFKEIPHFFKNKFHILLSSMTPAINSNEDLEKMCEFTKESCIYAGFASKRKNQVVEEIFDFYGVSYGGLGFGAKRVKEFLESKNYKYRELEFDASWSNTNTIEIILNENIEKLKMFNIEGKEADILPILEKYSKDGMVTYETKVKKSIIYWRVI